MARPGRLLTGTGLVFFGLYQLHVGVRQYAVYRGSEYPDHWEWPLLLGSVCVIFGWVILRSPDNPNR